MQIASILSDLNSLRVCDHSAALALVSVRGSPAPDQITATQSSQSDPSERSSDSSTERRRPKAETEGQSADLDMRRATDLVELHYGVKMKHAQGEDKSLLQARKDVDGVLERLRQHGSFE